MAKSRPPIQHPASPRDEEQTQAIWKVQDRMRARDPEPGDNGEGGGTTVTTEPPADKPARR